MSAPFGVSVMVLTEHWELDKMHRRAGRDARPSSEVRKHADSHKYCPLGRCGSRPGAYEGGYQTRWETKTEKIVRWRKAKAAANRRYLEEHVYGKATEMVHHTVG